VQVRPKQIAQEGAAVGQALVWNGLLWVPGTPTLNGDLGSMYISTPVITNGVGTTPVKANGTTTAIREKNFTHTNGRLTYNGTITKTFQATAAISAESTVANVTLRMMFAKNGAAVAASEITRKIGTANDVGAASLVCTADCSQNDYVEVFIALLSGSANITLDKMVLVVAEV